MNPLASDDLALSLAIEFRNQQFWEMLKKYVTPDLYERPEEGPLTILNVACGRCEEARCLCAFFSSGIYGLPTTKARLVGIDVNGKEIAEAQRIISKPPPTEANTPFTVQPQCHFIEGDASRMFEYEDIPKLADIVVVRHQYLMSDMEKNQTLWFGVMKAAIYHLSSTGLGVITSYKEFENQILLKILKLLPCEVILNEPNPFGQSIQDPKYPDVAYDKYVTLVKRLDDKPESETEVPS